MNKAEKKTWIVITSGDENLKDISGALKEKGFSIDHTLEAIGQIIVKGTDDMKKNAMKIKGVADILPSQGDINIGDPDSDLTW